MLTFLLAFLSISATIIWSFIFLFFLPIGIRINKISGSRLKKFQKQIKHASIWSNDEPEGWVCGCWFLGYIHVVSNDHSESCDLWLISSNNFYKNKIMEDKDQDSKEVTKDEKHITYWFRQGVFWRLHYVARNIKLPIVPIMPIQQNAVDNIVKIYNEKNKTVCLLYGVAGTGKSMTAQYLCASLLKQYEQVHFCDTHIPYEHGDNFDSLYNKINPSKNTPLVIVLEEIDQVITNLHHGKITQHHHIPVQIKNKTDWNSFLDKFDRNIYPYVIIIMTTNESIDFFDNLDRSYMRTGRVDLKLEFKI